MSQIFTPAFTSPRIELIFASLILSQGGAVLANKAAYMRGWNKRNPDKLKVIKQREFKKNFEKYKAYRKRLEISHKDHLAAYRRKYYNNKRHTDPGYKLHKNLQRRIIESFRRTLKDPRTQDIIGCTFDELKAHLERQFQPGMSWENYGLHGWHVDHKVPRSKFDPQNIEEVKRCYHFSNLQPLWAKDNYDKSDKVDPKYGNAEPMCAI